MRRRSWANMIKTKSTRQVAVGTVKKSHATISATWLFRKVVHVGDDGWRLLGRYFSTVDLATAMPSLYSSPTMRGAPPRWIGTPPVSDQLADLCGDGRSSRLATLAQPSPVISEALPLLGDDGAGLDKRQGVLPAGP
jgi:hypothetical protein